MRPISLRAMLVANAVQTAAAFVIFITACLAALGIAWGLAGFPADIDPITHQLKISSLFLSALTAITVLPSSLIAGYVAGRIAGNRPILHGALSGVLWIILLICVALGVTPSDRPPHDDSDTGSAAISFVMFFGPPLFGALGGFIRQHRTLSGGQAPAPSQFSKWWWLGYFGVQNWTAEERRARMTMGTAALVGFLAAMLVVGTAAEWLGIEPHWGAFISAMLSLIFGLYVGRPVATELYRDLVRKADESARQRLSENNSQGSLRDGTVRH